MRANDLRGFGPVGTNGTPSIDADLDTMRDVYMTPSQQAAFDRLAAALRALRDAPVVTVRETSVTYGQGSCGSQWTIGDDYMGRPEWASKLKDQRVRLVPEGPGVAG